MFTEGTKNMTKAGIKIENIIGVSLQQTFSVTTWMSLGGSRQRKS